MYLYIFFYWRCLIIPVYNLLLLYCLLLLLLGLVMPCHPRLSSTNYFFKKQRIAWSHPKSNRHQSKRWWNERYNVIDVTWCYRNIWKIHHTNLLYHPLYGEFTTVPGVCCKVVMDLWSLFSHDLMIWFMVNLPQCRAFNVFYIVDFVACTFSGFDLRHAFWHCINTYNFDQSIALHGC